MPAQRNDFSTAQRIPQHLSPTPPRGRAWPGQTPTLLTIPADSTMQTGHHWTASNGTNVNLNYTGAPAGFLGTQCIKLTTLGTGSGNQTALTLARQTAIDMTGKAVRALIYIDPASYAKQAYLKYYQGGGAGAFTWFNNGTLSTGADDPAHYIKAGEWLWVTLVPQLGFNQTGTPDPTQVRDFQFTIADDATGTTTVFLAGFQILPQDNATYPNGVISIGFDDGYLTQRLAQQYMDLYGYPGTLYLIRDRIGSDDSLWWNLAQLQGLQANGWELSVHCDTAADHGSVWGFQTLGLAGMTADLLAQRRWMTENDIRGQYGMALPKGGFDLTELPELRRQFGYVAGVTSTGRMYGETLPPMSPWRIRRCLPANNTAISPNSTRNTIQWVIDQVKASKCWLVLGYHNMVTTPVLSTDYPMTNFQQTVDYINSVGVPVRTVGDVLGIGP